MKQSFVALCIVLSLSGCRTTFRDSTEAPVPVPAQWDEVERARAVEGELPRWGELFDDRRLDSLIAEALEANPNLEIAAARLDRAVAQARIAGAELSPQLNAYFDAARRRQNFIGLPIPGAEDRVLSTTTTTFGTGLNVSWEADLWGRLRAGRAAARWDADAAREDFEGAALSLSGQVAKLWFSVIEAQQQLDLARATEANRVENAARIRRRYEAGIAPAVDVRLAESNAAAASARAEARRRVLDSATRQLETLLGRYPSADLGGSQLPSLGQPIPVGVPAQLLARRPDLRAAERRAVAANARVAQARAALYPSIRLTGSAGTSSSELGDLLDGDFAVWNIVGNIVQPLFDGGRLRAGVDLARAGERESVAAFAVTALDAFAEVESSLFVQDVLARQERALAGAVEHAREAQRSSEERYGAGLADYLLVLESQRQALEVESQLIDVRRQRLASRVDLYLALGGNVPISSEAAAGDVSLKEVQ
jgi:outer membrane protein, multidrug efflux system